jgi:hypothetical protein
VAFFGLGHDIASKGKVGCGVTFWGEMRGLGRNVRQGRGQGGLGRGWIVDRILRVEGMGFENNSITSAYGVLKRALGLFTLFILCVAILVGPFSRAAILV